MFRLSGKLFTAIKPKANRAFSYGRHVIVHRAKILPSQKLYIPTRPVYWHTLLQTRRVRGVSVAPSVQISASAMLLLLFVENRIVLLGASSSSVPFVGSCREN
jgi:hypothetical protein